MRNAVDESIENAFAKGELLRTHVMRPTWHFVSAADIGWMLKLTAARVNAANNYYYRKFELDSSVFRRTHKALVNALRGGQHQTRAQLRTIIERAGVSVTDPIRLVHILSRAELDGVICSGARKNNQFTYALLNERAPAAKDLDRDEAMAELTRRYFTSHGPATLQDFVWWSGLTASDAKRALEMLHGEIVEEVIDRKSFWRSPNAGYEPVSPQAHLLPAFDEYLVAYKDRSAVVSSKLKPANNVLCPTLLFRGRVVGTWTRHVQKNSIKINLKPWTSLKKADEAAIRSAAKRYVAFLNANSQSTIQLNAIPAS
jgi:hypothetical protein